MNTSPSKHLTTLISTRFAPFVLAACCWRRPLQKLSAVVGLTLLGSAPAFAQLWNTATPSMGQPRYALAATALPDGRILAAGGFFDGGSDPRNTAEIRNPLTGEWTAIAPMNDQRTLFGLVTLNGLVYALGGYDRDRFFEMPPRTTQLNSMEVYDPNTNVWTLLAPMQSLRSHFVAAVSKNKIYAIGGSDNVNRLASVEVYNPNTNKWKYVAPMQSVRSGHCTAVGRDGKIYVMGGLDTNTVEVYNPATNSWSYVAPMNVTRDGASAALGSDGKIYVAGGFHDNQNEIVDSVEVYDISANQWTMTAPMNRKRAYPAMVQGLKGQLFVMGGSDGEAFTTTSVEKYTFLELTSLKVLPALVTGGRTTQAALMTNVPAYADTLLSLRATNAAATVPENVVIPAGAMNTSFDIATMAVDHKIALQVIAGLEGKTKSANLTLTPIGVESVSIAPSAVIGSQSAFGTIQLVAPAAPDSITATVTSDMPDVADALNHTITIPKNTQTATFNISTQVVSEPKIVTFTVTANGTTKTARLTIRPIGVQSVILLPSTVRGMSFVIGVVTLTLPAAPDDIVVTLQSNNAAAILPLATITIKKGYSQAAFTVYSTAVSEITRAQISATANNISAFKTLTIKP